ncbi:hypothetical protein [Patulibacter minatonensis]|uniref:hypothetical protein n=1 Tax=Patulibacter minatonensis TaxID=298163 RepID=UPI000479C270|nr:hypothetical protein [Patulibacter minatonensis]
MSLRFTIDVGGDRIVDRTLSRLAGAVEDWTDAWPDIEDALTHEAAKQFDSQGEYGSNGWKRLSDSWLAYKESHDLDTRIGRATGAMANSLCIKGAHQGIRETAPGMFLFGSTVPYLPHFTKLRPVMQLPESGRREVQRRLQKFAMSVAD